MKEKLKLAVWVIIAALILGIIGGTVYNLVMAKTQPVVHPELTVEIENYGNVKMELYPEYAPNTVANIVKLVQKGYYDGKIVYGKDDICLYAGRDVEGKMINPKISLLTDKVEPGSENDYDYTIPGEFITNGFNQNTLRHEKGVLSLVRNDYTQQIPMLIKESKNSGNAQVAIMMSDKASDLNGIYAGFGRVIEGMDILEKIYNEREIAPNEKDEQGNEIESPIKKFKDIVKINKATVDTHGVDYGTPVTEEAFDFEAYMYQLMTQYYGQPAGGEAAPVQ